MRPLDTTDLVRPLPEAAASMWTVRASVAASRTSTVVVAAAAAIVTAGTALHPDVPVAAALIVVAMIPAVLVDVLVRRLPNRLVGGAALVGGVAGAVSLAIGVELRVLDGLIGAVAMAAPLLLVHLISPASMGFGDVKAALVFGAALGLIDPLLPVVALAVGSFGAAVHGLVTRSKTIAFGPGLLGGVVLVMIVAASPMTFDSDGLQNNGDRELISGAIS